MPNSASSKICSCGGCPAAIATPHTTVIVHHQPQYMFLGYLVPAAAARARGADTSVLRHADERVRETRARSASNSAIRWYSAAMCSPRSRTTCKHGRPHVVTGLTVSILNSRPHGFRIGIASPQRADCRRIEVPSHRVIRRPRLGTLPFMCAYRFLTQPSQRGLWMRLGVGHGRRIGPKASRDEVGTGELRDPPSPIGVPPSLAAPALP